MLTLERDEEGEWILTDEVKRHYLSTAKEFSSLLDTKSDLPKILDMTGLSSILHERVGTLGTLVGEIKRTERIGSATVFGNFNIHAMTKVVSQSYSSMRARRVPTTDFTAIARNLSLLDQDTLLSLSRLFLDIGESDDFGETERDRALLFSEVLLNVYGEE